MSDMTYLNASAVAVVRKAVQAQNKFNERLDPGWKARKWAFGLAMAKEATEAINHTHWEWWKKGTYGTAPAAEDIDAIRMRLCVILHFGLSVEAMKAPIEQERFFDRFVWAFQCARRNRQENPDRDTGESLRGALSGIVANAHLLGSVSAEALATACIDVGMEMDALMVHYFAKGALHAFRWENGYGVGGYDKVWFIPGMGEREDNEYLLDYIEHFNNREALPLTSILSESLQDQVRTYLQALYSKRKAS